MGKRRVYRIKCKSDEESRKKYQRLFEKAGGWKCNAIGTHIKRDDESIPGFIQYTYRNPNGTIFATLNFKEENVRVDPLGKEI